MFKCIFFLLLLNPLVAEAKQNADKDTSVVANGNGTYSITRAFSPNGLESPSTLDNEAEIFCGKRGKYFYFMERAYETLSMTLTFKCITDRNKAEIQKRLREIPVNGKEKRR